MYNTKFNNLNFIDDVVWFIVFDAIIKYRRKNIDHDLYSINCYHLLLNLGKEVNNNLYCSKIYLSINLYLSILKVKNFFCKKLLKFYIHK